MPAQKNPSRKPRKLFHPAELNELLREVAEERDSEFLEKISISESPALAAPAAYELISIKRVNWLLKNAESLAARSYRALRSSLERRKLNNRRSRRELAKVILRRIIGPGERNARLYFEEMRSGYPNRAAEIAVLVDELDDGFEKLRRRWSEAAVELREAECEREDGKAVGISSAPKRKSTEKKPPEATAAYLNSKNAPPELAVVAVTLNESTAPSPAEAGIGSQQSVQSQMGEPTRGSQRKARPKDKKTQDRRKIIAQIAATGRTGEDYIQALHAANLSTPIEWQKNENCPKSYPEAYNHLDPATRKKWRARIWDEKYKAVKALATTRS